MKNNKITIVLCTILAVLILIIILLLINIDNKKKFIKPPFEENVTMIPENLEYKKNILKISEGYQIYIEAIPKKMEDKYLKINLISDIDNEIWFKLRVLDSDEEIIAESGLLKPGDYLEKIELIKNINKEEKITYKIMGYEKDNYLSAGSISLNTRIGE